MFEFYHYLIRLHIRIFSFYKILRRALFISFLKDFFDKFLDSLGSSFQTLTPTREKAFLCILSLEYLKRMSCDVDERVVYVWIFEVLVKSFMMLEGALSL